MPFVEEVQSGLAEGYCLRASPLGLDANGTGSGPLSSPSRLDLSSMVDFLSSFMSVDLHRCKLIFVCCLLLYRIPSIVSLHAMYT